MSHLTISGRDRELMGCEASITSLQQQLRGSLARAKVNRIHYQLELARPVVVRFQARSRGAMCRNALIAQREEEDMLHDWATDLQAAVRRNLAQNRLDDCIDQLRRREKSIIALQAHVRRKIAATRKLATRRDHERSTKTVMRLQAVCRGHLARQARKEIQSMTHSPSQTAAIARLQAQCRACLIRRRDGELLDVLDSQIDLFVDFQAHLRGALTRRVHRAREEHLDDASAIILAIQSTARGVLARKKKQSYVEHVQHAMPALSSLQAAARAKLASQSHRNMQKALAKVEVAESIGGLQSFLRSRLAKKQNNEQKKKLEFVQPDVIGFQAVARGYLARQEYLEWREYLKDPHTIGALVFLQSLIRGFLARRRLWIRTSYLHCNLDKVVKIQALWRGRAERLLYDRLLTGRGVDVPTIQNYMHLLDDTDADYQRQIHTENLRREVVLLIRENQALETEVKELDTKIALITKNKMTFEELVHAKRSAKGQADQLGAHINGSWKDGQQRDPFTTHAHLDRTSQRKLELFEYLFFLLQSRGEYISRLLHVLMQQDGADEDRRLVEAVTLVLFGYGHEKREEYLFHKMLQVSDRCKDPQVLTDCTAGSPRGNPALGVSRRARRDTLRDSFGLCPIRPWKHHASASAPAWRPHQKSRRVTRT